MNEPQPATESVHTGNSLLRWLGLFVREVLATIVPAVLIALLINLFLAQATIVQGQSMEPTLRSSERLVVEKLTYRLWHGPRRGDVVVLRTPRAGQEMLIKRVVALPGEIIESRAGRLMIDGNLLEETWATLPGGGSVPRTTVPPLSVFVMGDNRGASNDSRSFGSVPLEDIIGRAWFSYWPPDKIGTVK